MVPDRMHFAIFATGKCGGALISVSIYLASGIANQGHPVDMITLNTSEEDLRNFYNHVEGLSKVNFYSLGARHSKSCILPLIKYYGSHKPDVIFTQLSHASFAAIIAKYLSKVKPLNIIVEGTILSRVGNGDAKYMPSLKFIPWLARLLYPCADGLIAKNRDILVDLRQVIGRKFKFIQTKVLPNPYDLERFKLLANEHVEHPWLVEKEVPVIISVGRLWAAKGFDVLISAFAGVLSHRQCRLIILGDGPDRKRLERMIRELNLTSSVDMPGIEVNPWKYMRHSSIFVLVSRWEGWPSAIMEAMVCGIPVITTDCPGAGKEMIKNEERGLIVKVEDIDGLKEAILRLLNDSELRATLATRASQYAKKYDYKAISRDYISFAESLLRARRERSTI